MKKLNSKFLLICFLSVFVLGSINYAQLVLPQPSPSATAYQKIGTTEVTINYSRPGVKGRTIWGGLVPYNEIWRTGANAATTIEFSTDVVVEGNKIPSGKYALFTIPADKEWTIIINNNWDQGGTSEYAETDDVVRFKVTPKVVDHSHEWMFFTFFAQSKNSAKAVLAWDKLMIPFTIVSEVTDVSSKEARVSPIASIRQRIGVTDVTVTYGSPEVKGRTVWGELVPFNKVWRTGANESTKIEFSTDVTIDGKSVPAGKYSLFTIPSEKEWTVILNSVSDQWGSYDYDESKDVLRFQVSPKEIGHHERLVVIATELSENSGTINIEWEKLKISFPVKTDVVSLAYSNISKAIAAAKEDEWGVYASGANFMADHDSHLDEAKDWADKAAGMTDNYFAYLAAAKVYHKLGNKEKAVEYIDMVLENAKKVSFYEAIKGSLENLAKEIKSK
ncbi:MAG: DUF2911 domain-containing protein [Bacteroidetes bacterium]|nr:DUF2911 domain-containing protein [Bacteroidota bacterium]